MTLDEAIEERLKVIEVQEKLHEEASTNESKEIIKSATDNDRQIVEWLMELKGLREEYANLNKISYGYYKELKEAKRFLKSATKVLNLCIPCDEDYSCSECINQRQNCDYDDRFKWRYADEALKLIGEDDNEGQN
jgi:hypothetical protein